MYLGAELDSIWLITESAQIQTAIRHTGQTRRNKKITKKMDELRLFALKNDLLKIYLQLQNCICTRNTSS
jgi:hypothetical protein